MKIIDLSEHTDQKIYSLDYLESGLLESEKNLLRQFLESKEQNIIDIKPLGDDAPSALKVEKNLGHDFNSRASIKISTTYFVGVDWLIPGILAIRVIPKLDNKLYQIDILKMLQQALLGAQSTPEIEDLLTIHLRQRSIDDSNNTPELLLFLITEFLHICTNIVQKGLRNDFYSKTEQLRYKVKGKILLSRTIANLRPGTESTFTCETQNFGIDIPINRFLKHVLKTCIDYLENQCSLQFDELICLARKSLPAFSMVGDEIDIKKIKPIKSNPIFRDYKTAVDIGKKILSTESIGYNKTKKTTPPYWINMAKLFELYVLGKLRSSPSNIFRIEYQKHINYQIPDFLCQSNNTIFDCFIADAKYKPKYSEISILMTDARQLAGYARLVGVMKLFSRWGKTGDPLKIPCLIIYSNQSSGNGGPLDLTKAEKIPAYSDFYKIGIKLPEREIKTTNDADAAQTSTPPQPLPH